MHFRGTFMVDNTSFQILATASFTYSLEGMELLLDHKKS